MPALGLVEAAVEDFEFTFDGLFFIAVAAELDANGNIFRFGGGKKLSSNKVRMNTRMARFAFVYSRAIRGQPLTIQSRTWFGSEVDRCCTALRFQQIVVVQKEKICSI